MNPWLQRAMIPLAQIAASHQPQVLSIRFQKAMGRRLQEPPTSFYDKIFWMSANSDTTTWSELADKVAVRSFVAERCGRALLPELYGIWCTADEVDFGVLPESFAIKTNNGCATNYLVRSKRDADLDAICRGLSRWLEFPYGELTGQLHYTRIAPKILAEELLFQREDPDATLVDYKFYCFGGDPLFCYVVSDRRFDQRHTHSRMLYDMGWNPLPEAFSEGKRLSYVERPSSLAEMVAVASKLSEGIPFVRVDLYEVNGAVKFSEMTFMPGMDVGYTEPFQAVMGSLISIPGLSSPKSFPVTTDWDGGTDA